MYVGVDLLVGEEVCVERKAIVSTLVYEHTMETSCAKCEESCVGAVDGRKVLKHSFGLLAVLAATIGAAYFNFVLVIVAGVVASPVYLVVWVDAYIRPWLRYNLPQRYLWQFHDEQRKRHYHLFVAKADNYNVGPIFKGMRLLLVRVSGFSKKRAGVYTVISSSVNMQNVWTIIRDVRWRMVSSWNLQIELEDAIRQRISGNIFLLDFMTLLGDYPRFDVVFDLLKRESQQGTELGAVLIGALALLRERRTTMGRSAHGRALREFLEGHLTRIVGDRPYLQEPWQARWAQLHDAVDTNIAQSAADTTTTG